MFLWLSLMTRCPPFVSWRLRQTMSNKQLCAGDLRVSSLLVSRFQVPTRKDVSVYVFSTQRLALMQKGQEPTYIDENPIVLQFGMWSLRQNQLISSQSKGSRVFPRMSILKDLESSHCQVLEVSTAASILQIVFSALAFSWCPKAPSWSKQGNQYGCDFHVRNLLWTGVPSHFQVPWYFLEVVTVDLACWVRISSWPVLIPEQQCFAFKLTNSNTCTFPLAKQSSPFHGLPEPTLYIQGMEALQIPECICVFFGGL